MGIVQIIVNIDPVTAAILHTYADSRHLSIADAAATLLFRDAAAMTGWPGQTGADLQRAMLHAALDDDNDGDEEE